MFSARHGMVKLQLRFLWWPPKMA